MKRKYVAPITRIFSCMEDVITFSVEVMGDDNVIFWPGQAREIGVWN